MKLEYSRIKEELKRILIKRGFNVERAEVGAKIIADNSLDGVYSHGLNRFPMLVEVLDRGDIDPKAEPVRTHGYGALEQWDGNYGFGPINAQVAMGRAIELAQDYGIGCVALRHTNHWLRGATYGIQAANAGCVGICMTNTFPNMPPWGATEKRIGNNPFIMAVPESKGGHVVLDMAQSQFSFGKLQSYALAGDMLPMVGGYDKKGVPTKDPNAIVQGGEVMPTGYWKGSGLAIAIDMVVAALSVGQSTYELREGESDAGISQVFIAINPRQYAGDAYADHYIKTMKDYIKSAKKAEGVSDIRYPGERTYKDRVQQQEEGIFVDDGIWSQITGL